MSHTHTLAQGLQVDGVSVYSDQVVITDDEILGESVVVPASTTNQPVRIAFAAAHLTSMSMRTDQEVTVKTNSTSAPSNTFDVKPRAPVQWYSTSGITNPISADVTVLYVTNAGATNANVDLSFLIHGSV